MGFYGFSSIAGAVSRAALPKPDDPFYCPLGNYGDDFKSAPIISPWMLRNIAPTEYSFPGWLTNGIRIRFNAQGDAIYRPAPGGDFEIVAHLSNEATGPASSAFHAGMMSVAIVDSSGAGIGFSPYNDGNAYNWVMSGWAYASTGTGISISTIPSGVDYYLRLKKAGTTYTGYVGFADYDSNTITWMNNAGNTSNITPAYIGIVRNWTAGGTNLDLTIVRFLAMLPSYVP